MSRVTILILFMCRICFVVLIEIVSANQFILCKPFCRLGWGGAEGCTPETMLLNGYFIIPES